MDIEKLTKSQIVLLTLLVSFVTSIATGIVTVSLMQQAPPAIAQTVNRVVEHTIETVATTTSKGQTAAVAVVQKTVVVNDSDLIAEAVKGFSPSVVRIYADDTNSQFLGLGTVIDASGTIVSDLGALGERAGASVETAGGDEVKMSVISRDQGSGLLYLVPAASTTQTKWIPAPLSKIDPALGAVVVALSGKNAPRIAQGLVDAVDPANSDSGSPDMLETDLSASSILPGAPLIDTTGALVGVSTSVARSSLSSGFISASLVSNPNAAKSQN